MRRFALDTMCVALLLGLALPAAAQQRRSLGPADGLIFRRSTRGASR